MARKDVSFLFDLDGTLVDSVYQHVVASQEALWLSQISSSRCGASTAGSA
jgi:beta-phosphoglucomutase-like phosphatase (HAD superfamily)